MPPHAASTLKESCSYGTEQDNTLFASVAGAHRTIIEERLSTLTKVSYAGKTPTSEIERPTFMTVLGIYVCLCYKDGDKVSLVFATVTTTARRSIHR